MSTNSAIIQYTLGQQQHSSRLYSVIDYLVECLIKECHPKYESCVLRELNGFERCGVSHENRQKKKVQNDDAKGCAKLHIIT